MYLDNEREKCNAESHHLFRSVRIGKLNGVPLAYLSNGSFRTTPIQRIEDSSTLEGFNIGMLLWPPPTYDIDDETNADNARMAQELMGESVEKLADVNINIRKQTTITSLMAVHKLYGGCCLTARTMVAQPMAVVPALYFAGITHSATPSPTRWWWIGTNPIAKTWLTSPTGSIMSWIR